VIRKLLLTIVVCNEGRDITTEETEQTVLLMDTVSSTLVLVPAREGAGIRNRLGNSGQDSLLVACVNYIKYWKHLHSSSTGSQSSTHIREYTYHTTITSNHSMTNFYLTLNSINNRTNISTIMEL
jgi:hypothetical protein